MGWLIVLAYIYGIIENVHGALGAAVGIGVPVAVIALIVYAIASFGVHALIERDEDGDKVREAWSSTGSPRLLKFLKYTVISTVIAGTLNVLVPDREGMKYIAGAAVVAYSAEAVSNIEGIDRLPANVVNVVNKLLEDIANDLDIDPADVRTGAGAATEAATEAVTEAAS